MIERVGLSPIRVDEEMIGGIIYNPMYERLIISDYAIADLTTAKANVFMSSALGIQLNLYHFLFLKPKQKSYSAW